MLGKDNSGVYSNTKKLECVPMPNKRVIFANTLVKISNICY